MSDVIVFQRSGCICSSADDKLRDAHGEILLESPASSDSVSKTCRNTGLHKIVLEIRISVLIVRSLHILVRVQVVVHVFLLVLDLLSLFFYPRIFLLL